MPSIVLGQASSCSNPLLPFFYQEGGLMADLYALRYEVFRLEQASILVSGTIDTDLCSEGGNKIATGYYVAPLDPQVEGLDEGPYEIVWYYKPASTDAEQATSYYFEVLNASYFRVSRAYEGYAASNASALSAYDAHERQQAIFDASRQVERLTERIFFPRYMALSQTVRPSSRVLWFDQPVIGLSSIVLESADVVIGTLSTYEVDITGMRVFNRHLGYLLSPDDRDNPKIAFANVGEPNLYIEPPMFPSGCKNVTVTGVFGYTDPDGGPFGIVPPPIAEVVTALAYKRLLDPLGKDPFLQQPGTVRSARTRDQSITFDTSGFSSSSSLTGDERLDKILLDYYRPPHVGVAG